MERRGWNWGCVAGVLLVVNLSLGLLWIFVELEAKTAANANPSSASKQTKSLVVGKANVTSTTARTVSAKSMAGYEEEVSIPGLPKMRRAIISEWPSLRAYLWKDFLTHEEAQRIIQIAEPELKPSEVHDSKPNETKGVVSKVRTSKGMFLLGERAKDPTVKAVRARIAAVTGYPESHFEATQVLRYNPGEQYLPHPDFFDNGYDDRLFKRGGQRMCTFLCYLNTPEGGRTKFPAINASLPAVEGECVQFFTARPDRQGDPLSIHASEPSRSIKWSMPTWIHEQVFA